MSFIDELKRRKVFRVAASYAVVAWILMQIGEVTFPALNIPDWVMSTLVVILLAGFPIAVIFAWVFDKTPQGYIKTDAVSDGASTSSPTDSRPFYLKKRNIFLILGVVAGILIGSFGGSALTNSSGDGNTIAVLPFDNYSNAPEDQYFSDGITEDIIAQLSKIGSIKVISRTSVMKFKNTTKNLKQIANELGASHILEGSVRKQNEKVRIVGQLIEAKTDNHLWADTYDRDLADIFTIQSDVALEIASAMKTKLSDTVIERISKKPTDNVEAYDLYLRSNEYYERNNLPIAIDLLNRAVGLDGEFAAAFGKLAFYHSLTYHYGLDRTKERLTLAKNAFERAIEIDSDSPISRQGRGYFYYYAYRDYYRAMRDFEFASQLEPGNSEHHYNVGLIQRRLGFWDESTKSFERGLSMNPGSFQQIWNMSLQGGLLRDLDMAMEYANKAIKNSPDAWQGYNSKSRILRNLDGDIEGGLSVLKESPIATEFPFSEQRAAVSIYTGRFELAEKILSEINGDILRPDNGGTGFEIIFTKPFMKGLVRYYRGERQNSTKWFKKHESILFEKLDGDPANDFVHGSLAVCYAYLGEAKKAERHAEIALGLFPFERDHYFGTRQYINRAHVMTVLGEYDKALEDLEFVLSVPAYFSYKNIITEIRWRELREKRDISYLEKKGSS